MHTKELYYLPEWYPQDAVLLAWPHERTDWRYNLKEVVATYIDIISKLSEFEKVIVLCHNKKKVEEHFIKANKSNILFIEENYNDTWTRDYGPITVLENGIPKLLDFQFNGWGAKYDAELDNGITKRLYNSGIFNENIIYSDLQEFVLEGGSIDTDGNGTLLTTTQCLMSKKRNTTFTLQQIEQKLKENIGVQNILWLNHGKIEGDDTDGHIDTLAKFCNEKTIVYASCEEEQDPHFYQLKKMEEELVELRNINNEQYNLVKLPLPDPVFNSKKKRLPATYVNFLITNEAVLVPSYRNKKDNRVKNILSDIFMGKKILFIDCISLIKQFGSLHCITIQLPKKTLKIS